MFGKSLQLLQRPEGIKSLGWAMFFGYGLECSPSDMIIKFY